MKLSVVIVTHNRREALRYTLRRLDENLRLGDDQREVIVVDNASTDGTDLVLAAERPAAVVLRRPRNEGVSARNHAFAVARGRYVLLIDDDSHPVGDAAERSIDHLDRSPRTAAVVGRVQLPDGRLEASALPTVPINCAVVLRKAALDRVGGFPTEFFRQAEEYDLAFRLYAAGYTIDRFEDLVYRHNKAPGSRHPAWIHRLDVRNNLILAARYLPDDLRAAYRDDWTLRYRLLARHAGHARACRLGEWQGRWWDLKEARRGRRTLAPDALEAALGLDDQARRVRAWAQRTGARRVLLADFSKNVYATHRACLAAGLDVAALIDNHPAYAGHAYRGTPILPDDQAPPAADGVVLSNVNPAQVEARAAALRQRFGLPVLTLWEPRRLADAHSPIATPAAA